MNRTDERDSDSFEIERLLARDAEDVAHALGLEALDEDVGRSALGHARYPVYARDSASATHTGLPPPARSNVSSTVS